MFIVCSNSDEDADTSINLNVFSNSNYYAYYLEELIDFDSNGDKKVICFQLVETLPVQIIPCYDFSLVENIPEGGTLPSSEPIAFLDLEENEYVKGSDYGDGVADSITINGIPVRYALPLLLLYALWKWGSKYYKNAQKESAIRENFLLKLEEE